MTDAKRMAASMKTDTPDSSQRFASSSGRDTLLHGKKSIDPGKKDSASEMLRRMSAGNKKLSKTGERRSKTEMGRTLMDMYKRRSRSASERKLLVSDLKGERKSKLIDLGVGESSKEGEGFQGSKNLSKRTSNINASRRKLLLRELRMKLSDDYIKTCAMNTAEERLLEDTGDKPIKLAQTRGVPLFHPKGERLHFTHPYCPQFYDEPSNDADNILAPPECPALMQDPSWTQSKPKKEMFEYSKPSESIGSCYTPSAKFLRINNLPPRRPAPKPDYLDEQGRLDYPPPRVCQSKRLKLQSDLTNEEIGIVNLRVSHKKYVFK